MQGLVLTVCSPFRYPPEPPRYDFSVTWPRTVYGVPIRQLNLPAVRRKPIQPEPQGSRIVPRKVPGMEDHMNILDRFFPSRRRRREEERRQALARQVSPDTSPDLATVASMAALAALTPWGFSSDGGSSYSGGDSGGGSSGGSGE